MQSTLIDELLKRITAAISETPTGTVRNTLCDANIALQHMTWRHNPADFVMSISECEEKLAVLRARIAELENE